MSNIASVVVRQLKDLFEILWGHEGFATAIFTGHTGSNATVRICQLLGINNSCSSEHCWCGTIEGISGTVVASLEHSFLGDDTEFYCHELRIDILTEQREENTSDSYRLDVHLKPVELRIFQPNKNSLCPKDINGNEHLPQELDECCLKIQLKSGISADRYQALVEKTKLNVNKDHWRKVCDEILWNVWGPPDDMRTLEILRCQQSTLYRSSRMKRLLPEAVFIPLTCGFIEWLGADGILLPNDHSGSSETQSSHLAHRHQESDSDSENWGSDYSECEVDAYQETDEFRCIERSIASHVKHFGKVFPKLNWSSTKDAKWMLGGKLLCESSEDVLLLLKTSTWIMHDIDKAFSHAIDRKYLSLSKWDKLVSYRLCLKEPLLIKQATEFRVFFWGTRLLGISQRDVTCCYDILIDNADVLSKMRSLILEFFVSKFLPSFESLDLSVIGEEVTPFLAPLPRGAFDVYFTESREGHLQCKLLDVSPWGRTTDPLLFEWCDLRDKAWEVVKEESETVELRYVQPGEVRSQINPELSQRFPQDILDVYNNDDRNQVNIDLLVSLLNERAAAEKLTDSLKST